MKPQRVLITGGARRIGRAIALALAADGHRIAIHHHRSRKQAQTLADLIRADEGTAITLEADLADEEAAAALVERAAEGLGGPVTLLVNNASVIVRDDLLSATRESWDANLSVNLRAPFVLSQAFARAFLAQTAEENGLIVHLIDHRVWKPNPLFATYSLSKAGLWWLTRTMAQALAPRIRVNAIGPGPVLPSPHQDDDAFAAEAAAVPLGRAVGASEIAEGVRFLLRAPSMTGQMLALDGGQHLAWTTPDVAASGG